jgi:trimeric autotransporter adhesin
MFRILVIIALLTLSSIGAMAQAASLVTASSDGSKLHFTGPAKAANIKVEAISEKGTRLFETSSHGNSVDWSAAGSYLPGDGSYLLLITVENAEGKAERGIATVSARAGKVLVQSAASITDAQRRAIGREGRGGAFELSVVPTLALAPAAESVESVPPTVDSTTDPQSTTTDPLRPTLAYINANFTKFVPGAEQLSIGDANGTAPMINLRGGSTCCSGPGGHTPAWFKVFQNGSFVATGNLGIGVSPMQGKGYRTSWDSYKGAFRSGYADAEWDDANVGFFSWAGGSNSTAIGLYALAFGDTNSAESTSSIVFGSGNQVKGAAGFSAGAGNRVCDTYGVALGNNAKSGGPLINGRCDPDTFNIRGLAAVAIGYNVTASEDHTTAMGKFASNNGFAGTFIWSDGSAQASADTFRNTANNEFAARATGGFRFRTNLGGTTGCNLPAGSGVFNCTSSRTTKENFQNVSSADVLSKIRKLPVSTWNYIAEGQQSRHLGPMAEDFYKTFGLGESDKSIGIQDLAGVSLAGVKALEERTADLQTENSTLKAKLADQDQKLNTVQDQLKKQQAEIDELKKLVLTQGKGEKNK